MEANALSAAKSPGALASAGASRRRRHFQLDSGGIVPGVVLLIIVLAAVFAPLITPYDPAQQNIGDRLGPPAWEAEGSWTHPLGTDQLGRDTYSRTVFGARVSLAVGFAGVIVSGIIGTLLGLLAGYFGGWVDGIVMRLVDTQLAFPRILLAISIIAMLGPSVPNLVIVLGIAGWMDYARMVRAQVLSLREKEYVLAARCIGQSSTRIISRHILPNTVSVVIVIASVSVATNIITESSLSFLGLGVGSDSITWGTMLADARNYISVQGWLATFPGLAIMLTVLTVNLLGDWLRDTLDPLLKQ